MFWKNSLISKSLAEAADGKEAFDLAGELNPDIVIMDISMPSKRAGGNQANKNAIP
jgi:YesN/AraC family two-component response regulator